MTKATSRESTLFRGLYFRGQAHDHGMEHASGQVGM